MTFKTIISISVLIGSFIFLNSCGSSNKLAENKEQKQVYSDKGMSFLALGDSYTIGELVSESERWPNILANELNQQNIPTKKPVIIAKTGWRTDELIDSLKKHEAIEKYDIISILIGVNNQYQNKSIETFVKDLKQLVELAAPYSKRGLQGIFAFSIPDYGVMPAVSKNETEISKEIENWNEAYMLVMKEFGIPFYDITYISKQAKKDHTLIAGDKLHPSGQMYKIWVDKYVNQIINDVIPPQKDQ